MGTLKTSVSKMYFGEPWRLRAILVLLWFDLKSFLLQLQSIFCRITFPFQKKSFIATVSVIIAKNWYFTMKIIILTVHTNLYFCCSIKSRVIFQFYLTKTKIIEPRSDKKDMWQFWEGWVIFWYLQIVFTLPKFNHFNDWNSDISTLNPTRVAGPSIV